jgi:Ser-tRNA(Ala) deacylase AlaX
MTELLYLHDAYLRQCQATVTGGNMGPLGGRRDVEFDRKGNKRVRIALST